MNVDPLPIAPGTEDFRALARSSPWRFTTLHFTHRRQRAGGSAPTGEAVEGWLDRSVGRVTVRTSRGLEMSDGVPYSTSWILMVESGTEPPDTPDPPAEPVLRPDGLVAQRPEGWHVEHGDPMWQDYLWTAMLDPLELSYGVGIAGVEATTLRGRPTWAATCRPLMGMGEEWEGGYDPRCSCWTARSIGCWSTVPRTRHWAIANSPRPTASIWTCKRASSWTSPRWTVRVAPA